MLCLKSIRASGLLFLPLLWLLQTTEASAHDYSGEKFMSKGNAFVVHGGSEGIYSYVPNLTESPSSSSNSDSFIRKSKVIVCTSCGILGCFLYPLDIHLPLNKLQARSLLAKLDIYRKFTNALAVAVIVSVRWMCYELYFKSTDVYNERWQNAWIIPAFWQVLSFSLLCIISTLWSPSQNSMRYAYSNDGEEFEKVDTLTLIKPSPVLKDVRSQPEVRPTLGNNELSNDDEVERQDRVNKTNFVCSMIREGTVSRKLSDFLLESCNRCCLYKIYKVRRLIRRRL